MAVGKVGRSISDCCVSLFMKDACRVVCEDVDEMVVPVLDVVDKGDSLCFTASIVDSFRGVEADTISSSSEEDALDEEEDGGGVTVP